MGPTTHTFVFVALILVVASMMAPSAVGVTIYGAGPDWSVGALMDLSSKYLYYQYKDSMDYSASANITSSIRSLDRGIVVFVGTPAIVGDAITNGMQGVVHTVPLMGTAMALAVNGSFFPNSSAASPVVLDVEALAAMWSGAIVSWDDPRVQALNPTVAMPASAVGFVYCDRMDSEGDVIRRFLLKADPATFGPIFDAASASGANPLAALAPAMSGRSTVACSLKNKTDAMEAMAASVGPPIGMMMIQDLANAPGLSSCSMRVRALSGNGSVTVAPTASNAVANAMTITHSTAATDYESDDITTDGAYASWPLSTFVSIVTGTDLVMLDNCNKVKYVYDFASWLHLNEAAIASMSAFGYTPLGSGHRRQALDRMTNVTCDGSRVIRTSFLLGSGPYLPVYANLATDFKSATTDITMKYYASTSSLQAIEDMIDDSMDFGSTGATLTADQESRLPDGILIPMLAYATMFGYNIPELIDSEPLVLSVQLLAGIYNGSVEYWDDARITALNPGIASLIPHQPIIVIYIQTPQVIAQVTNTFISSEVPEYNATVGSSNLGTDYPVVSVAPNRTIGIPTQSLIFTVPSNTPYSFSHTNTFISNTVPNVRAAAIMGKFSSGRSVLPDDETIAQAISNSPDPFASQVIYSSPGNNSWPIVAYNSLIVRSTTMTDCTKAAALAEWIYWTQASDTALGDIKTGQFTRAANSDVLLARILDSIVKITCNGEPVSTLAGCIEGGTICSNRGTCTSNKCACSEGWTGAHCEVAKSAGGGDTPTYVIAIASVLPVVAAIVIVVACIIGMAMVASRLMAKREVDDWDIDMEELEIADLLGAGAYGEVSRAMWKGTEVAVKVISMGGGSTNWSSASKEQIDSFVAEVRIMSRLRHPNVVLFMAACTKPPKLCIVMEYMALGSLFDLLHNELITEIPMGLKVKVLYQAAKGMHFLHSSNVVHRDLKSLNLLLDNKWNVKVSDFGLTKLKTSIKNRNNGKGVEGTVRWMAPEILSENSSADPIYGDVYAFGIIMWEVLTREVPYEGKSDPQIAVGVIRDNMRPANFYETEDISYDPATAGVKDRFVSLMGACWHQDPTVRPTFLEIMTELSALNSQFGGTGTGTSTSSASTSTMMAESAATDHGFSSASKPTRNVGGGASYYASYGSKGTASSTASDNGTASSNASGHRNDNLRATSPNNAAGGGGAGGMRKAVMTTAHRKMVSFATCDLIGMDEAWRKPSEAYRTIVAYTRIVRDEATKRDGYIFSTPSMHACGMFNVSFNNSKVAMQFCTTVQQKASADDLLAQRSRIGVSWSQDPKDEYHKNTYRPEDYNEAYRLCSLADPMEILCSEPFARDLRSMDEGAYARLATDSENECYRIFAGDGPGGTLPVTGDSFDNHLRGKGKDQGGNNAKDEYNDDDDDGDDDDEEAERGPALVRYHGRDEDAAAMGRFRNRGLCSANSSPFIIDDDDITVCLDRDGREAIIGSGNYGIVLKGEFKNLDVALKRLFGKNQFKESSILDMWKEAAFFSSLDHPHIVKLMGLCIKKDISLVMEFVAGGSLEELIFTRKRKFTLAERLHMLKDAAVGLDFLHQMGCIHRDFKPSNLLVDEDARTRKKTIKVADFGFASVKDANAGTMTRCGSPLWMAPELFRNDVDTTAYEQHSDGEDGGGLNAKEKEERRKKAFATASKVDVYAFGIVMWQMMTMSKPFTNADGFEKNIGEVGMLVSGGARPPIPLECPKDIKKMIKRCWHADPAKRPEMADVVYFLNHKVDSIAKA